METIQPNAHVTLEYSLSGDDGRVLDKSDGPDGEPIRYVHGYGMLVPGLEAALGGLRAGDQKKIDVAAEQGFGDRDEGLVLEIERGDFPDPARVKPGDEFVAESPDGEEVVMRVLEVKGDAVLVDANHPLAGKSLHYAVRVKEVRAATDIEIQAAAEDLASAEEHAEADRMESGEHVHGPGCAHDDDDLPNDDLERSDVIQIRKKTTPPPA